MKKIRCATTDVMESLSWLVFLACTVEEWVRYCDDLSELP